MPLPITLAQAERASRWLKQNFGPALNAAVADTRFDTNVLCGICCQETAYFWLSFIGRLPPDEILARCVLDASGDVSSSPRGVFPRNTAEFRARYGDNFTNMLIAEANETRRLRNMRDARYVYKGYGIFQYDLQYVVPDRAFFEQREWYRLDACLRRVMAELHAKSVGAPDLRTIIRRYNGSGERAARYADNVMAFIAIASRV